MPVDRATEAALWDLSVRYAAAADRGDEEDFVDLFAEGGSLIVRNGEAAHVVSGREELRRIPAMLRRYERTFHFLGQSRFWETEGGLRGEVVCTANHLLSGTNRVMYIRYLDDYEEAEGRWWFRSREVHVQWTEDNGVPT